MTIVAVWGAYVLGWGAYAVVGVLVYHAAYRAVERYNPGGFERDPAKRTKLALTCVSWPAVVALWLIGKTKRGDAWLERAVHRMELDDPVRAIENEQQRQQALNEREQGSI